MLVIALLLVALVPCALVAKPAPAAPACPTDEQPPVPPVSFSSTLATFISYSDDVSALRSWFETLSPAEQQQYLQSFQAALDKLAAMEDALVKAVLDQIDCSCGDSNLYLVFDTIRGMDPIKGRKIFSSAIDKLSARVNQDYVMSPSNPDLARRARDMQAVRAYIGHDGN
jgi:hypothetical protein